MEANSDEIIYSPNEDGGVAFSDEDAAAWYAAAAAGDAEEDGAVGGDASLASDPYLADGAAAGATDVASDPYLAAVDPYVQASESGASGAVEAAAESSAAAKEEAPEAAAAAAAAAAAETSATVVERPPVSEVVAVPVVEAEEPSAEPPQKARRIETAETATAVAAAPPATEVPSSKTAAPAATAPAGDAEERARPPPAPPAPSLPCVVDAEALLTKVQIHSPSALPEADLAQGVEATADPVAPVKEAEGEDPEASLPWDERVIVVRQGQIHIELQNQNPPMHDSTLLKFCDWLDEQLPLVVANFPYIKKSGAYVDLSDNVIGPEGLDKLFRVLRDHRVPCVVMKAYRNVLDDSIVDTLIEYLYTQPEAFPMHGIHISHNVITDVGALRLIRAASKCGHYPRLTTRLPLWLRLEANDIRNPQKVVADCLVEGSNVCLMKDGLCSRRDCNHYTGVHCQLPYFFHQGKHGGERWNQQPAQEAPSAQAPPAPPMPAIQPDWVSAPGLVTPVVIGTPAPKRAPFVVPPRTPGTTAKPSGAPPPFRMMNTQFVSRPPGPPAIAGVYAADFQANRPGEYSNAYGHGYQGYNGGGRAGVGYDGGGGYGGYTGSAGYGHPTGDGGWRRGGGKGGGWKGGGGRRGLLWQGPALDTMMDKWKETKLTEVDTLGFQWRLVGEGKPPQVNWVDHAAKAAAIVLVGDSLLRINGLDAAMFTEKQINDMLKQRPLTLRFGDP